MARIAVLGAGLVGSVIARDLATGHEVTAVDLSEEALARLRDEGVATQRLDLRDRAVLHDFAKGFDVVVCAVPSRFGYATLETLIDAGCRIADIAFTPENVLALHERARARGATLLTDIGVAPGISNLLLGHHDAHMRVRSFLCHVGGNPRDPQPPFRYRATFAPSDVIEEYTRPARIKRDGAIIERPALAEREMVRFEGFGEFEAFLTDGLRSILETMAHVPDLVEKTLRWPGHVDIVHAMREAGFFSRERITLANGEVIPLELAVALLGEEWRLREGEQDMLLMRVIVEGEQDGGPLRHEWTLSDVFDAEHGFTAMSRTTGFTCAAAANLLAEGYWHEKGVFPAEIVGRNDVAFAYIFKYLDVRGVRFAHREEAA